MTAITAAASAVGELWREIVEAETFLLINLYEWLGEIKRSFFETNTESISFRVVLSFLVCVSHSPQFNESQSIWLLALCLLIRLSFFENDSFSTSSHPPKDNENAFQAPGFLSRLPYEGLFINLWSTSKQIKVW